MWRSSTLAMKRNNAVNAIFVTTSESQTMFEQNPHE
jgi:hypothetical protein